MRPSVAIGIGPIFAIALSLNAIVPGLGEFAAGRLISAGMPEARQQSSTKAAVGPLAQAARQAESHSVGPLK